MKRLLVALLLWPLTSAWAKPVDFGLQLAPEGVAYEELVKHPFGNRSRPDASLAREIAPAFRDAK